MSTQPYPEESQQQLQVSTWVQLPELSSLIISNEAILLCQHSEDQWLAWIPDYGEIILDTSYFDQNRSSS
ncbi:hypothetical protein BLD44_020340 [Mastigocladus laminosus UU774]|nr:hypothetical protein BLD44_020340 [Mastigocladus laminosus UU774]